MKFSDEQKLKNLLETSSNLFYQHDTNHVITYLSPQIKEILGYEVHEAMIKWTELVSDNPINEVGYKNTLKAIKTGEKQDPYELELFHKSGKKIWVEVREVPILKDGKTISIVGTLNDITKRKINHIKLKDSEEKHRILFENVEAGIGYYDLNGNVILYNKLAAKRLGGKPKDFIGRNLKDLFKPELAEIILKRIHKTAASCKSKEYNDEILLPIGKKYFLSAYSCTRDISKRITGVQIISTDITELRIAEEKLKESDRIFRSYFNSNPVPTFVWLYKDNQFQLIDLNESSIRMSNGKAKQLLGLSSSEVYPEMPEIHEKLLECTSLNKVLEFELNYQLRSAGRTEWVNFKLVPIDQEKFLMYSEMITSQKEAELALIKAKNKAEESDQLKTAFLSNMSHEIRTPMNGILGFTELLENPELSLHKQHEFIEIIRKSGNRMLNTVNDIIDISKLDSGQVEIVYNRLNLVHELEALHSFFKPEAEKKNLGFNLKLSLSKTDSHIETDHGKLISIITNLIKNAIKFTDEGIIDIFCQRMDDKLVFKIKDTGIGIPPDRHEAIFERFQQADIHDYSAREGSGLGLSIAKSYVELLGGEINLQSKWNEGSEFSFTIPWRESKAGISYPESHYDPGDSKEKWNILIVEDDQTSYEHLQIVLEDHSKSVFWAKSGEEAIRKFSDHPEIQIILMDVKMPGISGYEATLKIREKNKDVIIIAQTAYALEGEREKALKAGCNEYISKPINREKLLRMVYQLAKR